MRARPTARRLAGTVMKEDKKVVSGPDLRAEYDFASMKGGVRERYAGRIEVDDMRPEYDFDWSKARPNPYAARLKGRVVAVLLAPDVAPFFPSSESVNAALRAAIAAADRAPALPPGRRPTKARRPVRG